MTTSLQQQITIRLKRRKCTQKQCRNNNQDNIELIVFGKQDAKRTGFMCSQCLLDSQLLAQLTPIQKHSISIKKFMKTLTLKYNQYSEQKNSVNWGPNILDEERKFIKQALSGYEQLMMRGILEVVSSVKELDQRTIKQISGLYKDKDFEKLSMLLVEEDDEEQERIIVGNQLKKVTVNIMHCEGQYKMANEKQLRDKQSAIMVHYQRRLKQARTCLTSLIDTQRLMLKQLSLIQIQSQQSQNTID